MRTTIIACLQPLYSVGRLETSESFFPIVIGFLCFCFIVCLHHDQRTKSETLSKYTKKDVYCCPRIQVGQLISSHMQTFVTHLFLQGKQI